MTPRERVLAAVESGIDRLTPITREVCGPNWMEDDRKIVQHLLLQLVREGLVKVHGVSYTRVNKTES